MLLKALKRVFKQPLYILMGVAVSLIVFFISVFSTNLALIQSIFLSDKVDFWYKLHFLWGLIGGLQTSVFPLSAFTTIAISILLGINIPMLIYMIRANRLALQKTKSKGIFSSIGGTIGGALGIGCAACGSLVLTPILASLGAVGLVGVLPFHGAEFGLLGMILLLFSIYLLADKINDPLVCPVEPDFI